MPCVQPRHRTLPLRRTPLSLILAAAFLGLQAVPAQAAPQGGVVTAGSASIQQNGAVTDIHQASQKAAINWQGFGIAPHEAVNFHQPNASAIILNRVVGNEASLIQGALNANGRVFLVNANGILFTQGASVNTAGLVASTLNITDRDFLNGNFVFQGDGSGKGSILNLGTIKTTDSGYVALLGDQVRNQGVIAAQLGTVALSSGQRITLNFNGDSLLKVSLDEGTLNALVENGQAIRADGGKVILTAKAANGLLDAQVNNTGIVQAQTIGDLKGDIHVYAHGGTAEVDGTLDASAPTTGDGGFIETSGERVKVADSARITTRAVNGKTGTWLIDPTDYTIGNGGDITGATLGNLLGSNNVTIQSILGKAEGNGDIHVNDAVAWSADTILTLDAVRDININNAITIGGAQAGLTLKYGGDYNIRTRASYSGAVLDANGKPVAKQDTSGGVYGSVKFTNTANKDGLVINDTRYTLLYSMAQFDALDGANGESSFELVTGNYAVAQDWDAGGTSYSLAPVYYFNGTIAGLGNKITNFTMDNTMYFAGMVGDAGAENGGHIDMRDLGMENVHFTRMDMGGDGMGSGVFLGTGTGTLSNLYLGSGTIEGASGIVDSLSGTLRSSFSDVTVTGHGSGVLAGGVTNIINSHATGDLIQIITQSSNGGNGGGLARSANNLSYSYATGDVYSWYADGVTPMYGTTSGPLGGLLAYYSGSSTNSLSNAFATGNVVGGKHLGGLVGTIDSMVPDGSKGANIYNVYATGNVTSLAAGGGFLEDISAGGLIGSIGQYSPISGNIRIDNVFATGNVTAEGNGGSVGGLIGKAQGAHTNQFTNTLTNAYATGNVAVKSADGSLTSGVGGLIGSATRFNISNVYATGDVSGISSVGGLIGLFAEYSSIQNAYATGKATSITGAVDSVGGLFGGMTLATASGINNVFYNGDLNQKGVGNDGRFIEDGTTLNVTGLTGNQLADAQYYADGTINQVLANRAAEAERIAAEQAERDRLEAERQNAERLAAERLAADQALAAAQLQNRIDAASQTAGQQRGAAQQLAAFKPDFRLAASLAASKPTAIDQHIMRTADRAFSADIQRIQIDGATYEMQDDTPPKP